MEAGGIERDAPVSLMMRKCMKTGFFGVCGRFDLTTLDPFRPLQTASIGHTSGTLARGNRRAAVPKIGASNTLTDQPDQPDHSAIHTGLFRP